MVVGPTNSRAMLFFMTKAINETQEALRVTFCNSGKGVTSAFGGKQADKVENH